MQSIYRVRSTFNRLDRVLRRGAAGDGDGGGVRSSAHEQPLQAELFSVSQLELHAKSLAGWHGVGDAAPSRGPDRLLPRLRANERVLRDAYEVVTDGVKRGRRITPAAEWFLDNYHLIEEQIRTARRHLPRGYSRELPRLTSGPSAGHPRVYDIALELISHADGRVDGHSLRAFVAAYQSVRPLRLGELWPIPIMLRLALLENLRRVAFHVMTDRLERERAEYWVEQMLAVAAKAPGEVVLVLTDMVRENPPLTTAFVAEFANRLQGQGPALVFAVSWLEQRLAEQGQTIEQVFQQASQNQAGHQVSIGNSIGSLRFLGAAEWRDFVEAMSVVEHALRADPAGVYPAMDFATRDYYRHAVERVAKRGRLSEHEVARKAVELAALPPDRGAASGDGQGDGGARAGRTAHVGYFLVDRGRRTLERAAGVGLSAGALVGRAAEAFPLTGYLGLILSVSAAVTGLVLWRTARLGLGPWGLAAVGALLVIPASHLAVALVHWVAMLFVRPRILPRMDYAKGIPPDHRTVVAVPTLLTDAREVDDLLEALEVRFLANRDENLSFALLSDFRDAAEETTPADAALLERARAGIEALNTRYACAAPGDEVAPPADGNGQDVGERGASTSEAPSRHGGSRQRGCFFLFHRARRWNASEGVWMGWERK